LLRTFDQLRWFPVAAEELLEMRASQAAGALPIAIEETSFCLSAQQDELVAAADPIEAFTRRQQAAFAAERLAWADSGELHRYG
jgi:urea carboxylase